MILCSACIQIAPILNFIKGKDPNKYEILTILTIAKTNFSYNLEHILKHWAKIINYVPQIKLMQTKKTTQHLDGS